MLSTLAIGTPPSSHFIYIPVILVLGIVLGFVFGSKAARDAIAFEQKKEQEREERRAKRQLAKDELAKQAGAKPAGTDSSSGDR